MNMKEWVPPLLKSLSETIDWVSSGDSHTIEGYREIGSLRRFATLYIVYVEEDDEFYMAWDSKLQVTPDARELYEKAIDSVNDYIVEFENGFGLFSIDPSGCILYAYSFDSENEKLHLTTVEDINIFADSICSMCNNIYLAILAVKPGIDMDQVLKLVCAPVGGKA